MPDTGKGHRQRLKERFLSGEPQARTDEALLELLLTYAIPQKDVQPLARRLLAAFGSLPEVLAADAGSLCAIDGIGEHVAVLLGVAARIGQSHAERPSSAAPPLSKPALGEVGRVEAGEPHEATSPVPRLK